MVSKITDETIAYVGILAKLELSDEEREAAKKDMADMLGYIDRHLQNSLFCNRIVKHVYSISRHQRQRGCVRIYTLHNDPRGWSGSP